MNNFCCNNLMFYQPKVLPLRELQDICVIFKKYSIIDKAYYCKVSYLDKSKIVEKHIVGVEISKDHGQDVPVQLDELQKKILRYNKSYVFVSAQDSTFSGHLLKEKPFFKKRCE